MKLLKQTLYAGAGLLSLAAIIALATPKVQAAARAALTEITTPSNPFSSRMQLSGTGAQSVGPGTGNLAISQIVITNFDSTVNQVDIYSALLSFGTCGGIGNIATATDPFLILDVQPNSTLVISPPTPLVFTPQAGYDGQNHTCLGASMPVTRGNVFVMVNGFTN